MAPILTTAVAISSGYTGDVLILAGAPEGALFRATGRGDAWTQADTGPTTSAISTLSLPDSFQRTGIGFAGTLGDGVLRCGDGGHQWRAWNFGLLDPNVLALEAARDFERNQTVLAGTATALYRSTNSGRAWQETGLPEVGPILSIALSPHFGEDGTAYAGTETGEILVSRDHGARWSLLEGPHGASSINALAVSPSFREDHRLVAADLNSVYLSEDEGATWSRRARFDDSVLALLLRPSFSSDGECWIGLSDGGVLRSEGKSLDRWQPAANGLGGRLISGLRSFPAEQSRLYAFGPWDGVHVVGDGEEGWSRLEGLPSRGVSDLRGGTDPQAGSFLYAALPQGVWRGPNDGSIGWECLTPSPANVIAISPGFPEDRTLAAVVEDGRVVVSQDGGLSWRGLDLPFQGLVLDVALTVSGEGVRLVVVVDDPEQGHIAVWQESRKGWWQLIVPEPGRRSGWLVTPEARPTSLYASLKGRLYRLPVRAGSHKPWALPLGEKGESVTAAALWDSHALAAATSRGVHCSADRGESWLPLREGLLRQPVTALVWVDDPEGEPVLVSASLGGFLWRRGIAGLR